MSQSTKELVERTVRVAPRLGPLLEEHLKDNFGEMLPHLYFGDLSRWAVDEVAKAEPSQDLSQLLALLETSYLSGDEDVMNLIDASFIEMIEDEPQIVSHLGPVLRARVER